ncbi:MAG TPA: hypothetical protein VGJ96_10115 [Gemmatimonadaceae bacterium]|jgi:hypothetical protein
MNRPVQTFSIARTAVIATLLLGVALPAAAQKGKQPAGPPVTTQGAVKSNPKADKGQATAEASRTEARERKMAADVAKSEAKALRDAAKVARKEPVALLKGVPMTKEQRKAAKESRKRYEAEVRELDKEARQNEKDGVRDATATARLEALRLKERAELRALLSSEGRARFDENVAAYGRKKP